MKVKVSRHYFIDTNSLRFKLWAYFGLFAIVLMLILWFLQIIFLQTYYQEVKQRQIMNIARTLSEDYSDSDDLDFTEVINEVTRIAYANDMYIIIEFANGLQITSGGDYPPIRNAFIDNRTLALMKRQITQSPSRTMSFVRTSPSGRKDTMVYGMLIPASSERQLEKDESGNTSRQDETFICVVAALSPVESTVDILASQLIYVTIVSLALAFALSLWLSRRITKPLLHITGSAAQLATGNYSVTFDGGHYTEITELADTLNYTSRELAKSDNLQKDLIANVSHDLRTPLTMVKSYAEMIRDLSGNNPEKRNKHLQVIIDEADRLNTLVSDMLTLSKMQSGVEAMRPEEFDIQETIRSLLQTYTILEEQEGYHFQFQSSGSDTVMIFGDETRLKQVISNLVTNAVRYGGEAKDVTVAITDDGSHTRITVTDKGSGIPQQELEHIWERYYKASSNGQRAASGGSGLGLSIVKEILLLHNATYGVDSSVGAGSTFWFTLPKSKPTK